MLGQGRYTAYLHDRGGETPIGQFDKITRLRWSRVMNDVSQASLVVSTPPEIPDCCSFYGDIRSIRHELVIFRNDERIWEGPVTRVAYFRDRVEIQARDVLFWAQRRVHRGRFADPANVVNQALAALDDALRYDDPNIYRWAQTYPSGGQTVRTAYNRADGTYFDALDDYTDRGLCFTAIGRRVLFWPSTRQIGQTAVLRSAEDFLGEVSVVEDGLALATRAVTNGNDEEFGASTPEPEVINYSINPEPWSTVGYGGTAFFPVTISMGVGTVTATQPAKPASGASSQTKSKYNKKLSEYQQTEIVLDMLKQAIIVHEGELLSARLLVSPRAAPYGKLGLRLRAILEDDEIDDDRSFAEGTPVNLKAGQYREITVSGTVPADVKKAFVEVYRDTSIEWKSTSNGFTFKEFGLWRGRKETWFDPDTADTSIYEYGWNAAPHNSTSFRRYKPIWDVHTHPHPEVPKISSYYGLVEALQSVDETTRPELEAASRDLVARSIPSPLAIDIPGDMPLSPNAEVSVAELVAGTTVPVETTATCRQLRASTQLAEVSGEWTSGGEVITVTLVSGRVWEIGDIDEPTAPFDPVVVQTQADREVGSERGE